MSLNTYYQGTKAGLFFNIFIIRSGPQIQMMWLEFRSKKFNPKVRYFYHSGEHRDQKFVVCSKGMKYNITFFCRIGCSGFGGTRP
jgi:hypothetical protein